MALQTLGQRDWEELLINIGISVESAATFAKNFAEERLTKDSLFMMDRAMLKELGIAKMREALVILKSTKEQPAPSDNQFAKAHAVKLPQLHLEMTLQQFRKFIIDWDVLKNMTNMPLTQANIQLYNCADEEIHNSIINSYPRFFFYKTR